MNGMDALKARAGEVAELLRQLANPTRLLLLCQISQGERPVSQLERETGLRQPALSQQLAELRQAGLVQTRKVSRQVFYAIADPRAQTLLHTLHALFCPDETLAEPVREPAVSLTAPARVPEASASPDVARFARLGV